MKKTFALLLCAALIAALAACVSIENIGDETDVSSSEDSVIEDSTVVSDVSSEDASSADETSEQPVYAPIYPENYEERVAYYANQSLKADVNDVYFNDSVFVGNSIMLHFKNYVTANRGYVSDLLGNSGFFAAASFSFYNNKHQKPTDADCALPVFRGEKLNIRQAVEAMEAKTVYLSLMALNDIALYKDGDTGVSETFALFTELAEDLRGSFPDTKLVVLDNTYLHKSSAGMQKLNNGTIYALNCKVLDYCNANGIDFIDVAEVLLDADGCLGTEFCSDVDASVACHLNNTAYNAWTEILRDYAAKKAEGRWANPTSLKAVG